jgi:hypothetical protein
MNHLFMIRAEYRATALNGEPVPSSRARKKQRTEATCRGRRRARALVALDVATPPIESTAAPVAGKGFQEPEPHHE